MTSSFGSLARGAAATAIALPLVVAPVAIPAASAATLVGSWGYGYGAGSYGGYGSYGSYGGGYGGYGSYGGSAGQLPYSAYGSYGDSGDSSQTSSGQTDATEASAAKSSGLVLIDTVLDYGEGEAAGTGLVIGSDGIVVTNHHVVQDATSITVTTPAGASYTASVIGYDATHDVAVLRLSGASGLATVTTDSGPVSSGEKVDAVGNAEGQSVLTDAAGTVVDPSATIDVSGDDGSTEHLTDLIETSADVVPGDSGGALLDSDDQAVGMNVAASSGSTDVTGYAIPIATVLSIAHQILAGTASSDVVLGGSAALGVELSSDSTEGLQIADVESTGAQQAGLEPGDTITSLAGTTVTTYAQLKSALTTHAAGDTVSVGYTDPSGDAETATITLGQAPVA